MHLSHAVVAHHRPSEVLHPQWEDFTAMHARS